MSLEDVVIPKRYKNSKKLFEGDLDAWRLATQAGFANINLNLQQLGKDCFGPAYDFDNDGLGNQATCLLDLINSLSAGGVPITGTSSATWTVHSGTNPGTLDTSGLTGSKTFLFPDLSGTFLLTSGAQSIGDLDLTQIVAITGSPNILNLIGAAHTTLTAGTEATDVIFNLARTVQFAAGAIASQRAFKLLAPTYGFVGASVITNAATAYISGAPIAGANCTITNPFALWVDSGRVQIDDQLNVGKAFTAGYLNMGSLSGAQTVDWSQGNTQKIIHSGNLTLSFSNPQNFQTLKLILQQSGSGSNTTTWPTNVRWMNGTGATDSTTDKPTQTTAANKFDVFTFHYDSDLSLYIGVAGGYKGAIT